MGQHRPLFCLFSFFSNTFFTEKTVDASGIQTRIVGVEGKHADHLTTTTALIESFLKIKIISFEMTHTSVLHFFRSYKSSFFMINLVNLC